MEYKFRIDFDETNVLGSVTYTLVSEFNLRPNILRAIISGDGHGFMLMGIKGEKKVIDAAVKRINGMGFMTRELTGHILHDSEKCWNCGACISLCPARSLTFSEDMRIKVNMDSCIACNACINGCSVKALSLDL